MGTTTRQASEGSVSDEELDKCYIAVIERRRTRGDQSIRTPEGFQRLHKRYQQVTSSNAGKTATNGHATPESETIDRQNVLNVVFNPKISQVITETCWRLALFGGGSSNDEMDCVGLELDEEKYATFTFRLIQWIIPELPRRAVQELVQYDWEHDRSFDDFGVHGLSLPGFKLSLIDLVISCTDGTVSKCLEFLNLMSRWLQQSLPPYIRDQTPQIVKVEATNGLIPPPKPSIVWNCIPLSTMTSCHIGPNGLHCELKAKICSAPMVIMVLSADEKPVELVLAARSKILLKKTEKHKHIYHKRMMNSALRDEFRRQGCWAFCVNPKKPSIVLVPGSNVNYQTKSLYACFRVFDSDQNITEPLIEMDESNNSQTTEQAFNALSTTLSSEVSSSVTIYSSVPELCPLHLDSKDKICHKMERMSSRIFRVEHRVQVGETFAITLTAVLHQSANSATGAICNTVEAHSTFTINDSYTISENRHRDAHTFVFVIKTVASKRNGFQQDEATLPQQWFTSLCAVSESKTIIFESSPKSSAPDDTNKGDTSERKTNQPNIYQLFIFTIHGINIEITCNITKPMQNKQGERSDPEVEGSDSDNPDEASLESEVTSAGLLKELLLLQKMRQLEKTAEPPPKFVVGTQVSTTKPVTTAELLRSKILRSHEEKRQAHFQQLEDAVRSKILERKSRGKQILYRSNKNLEPPMSPNSELEKRVNTITTFFHEMAVHQPKRDELHGSCAAEAAEAVAEAQLITTFGEMFNCDEDLQNALDEEKWSTDTTKVIRRRESISTNLPKIMPTEDVKGTRDQTDEGKDIPWTFEDYENTAQYIEQLMIDVATETTEHQKLQEVADIEQNHGVMKQLVASWQYTQHRVDKAATRKRLKEIEQKRRNQWMQSQHVQMYGDVASAKRGDKPERQIIILPKQRFLIQEHSLPSNAIWEVPGASNQTILLSSGPIAAVGLMSAARPMSPRVENDNSSPSKLRPQRPLQRPANMTTTERSSDTTALRSAAISRARVRRIRSAHSTTRGDSTSSNLQTRQIKSAFSSRNLEQPEQKELSPQQEEGPSIISVDADMKEGNNQLYEPNIVAKATSPAHLAVEGSSVSSLPPQPAKLVSSKAVDTEDASMEKTHQNSIARKRRLKKKRRSTSTKDVHFRQRVLELASISAKLQVVADEEWKEAQGIESVEELSSVLCLPKHLTK